MKLRNFSHSQGLRSQCHYQIRYLFCDCADDYWMISKFLGFCKYLQFRGHSEAFGKSGIDNYSWNCRSFVFHSKTGPHPRERPSGALSIVAANVMFKYKADAAKERANLGIKAETVLVIQTLNWSKALEKIQIQRTFSSHDAYVFCLKMVRTYFIYENKANTMFVTQRKHLGKFNRCFLRVCYLRMCYI